MTILDEFITDLEKGLKDYQTSRPFHAELRANRTQDVNQLKLTFKNATSAVALRRDVLKIIEEAKVGSISPMAWLDLNALRVRIRGVTDRDEYSIIILLSCELAESRAESHLWQQEVRTLRDELNRQKTCSPEVVAALKEESESMKQTIQYQSYEMNLMHNKHDLLTDKLTERGRECEDYKEKFLASEEKCENLQNGRMEVLQTNKQLLDEITRLKSEMAALKQAEQPKQDERKKSVWYSRFTS